jgi:hypothetical protein
MIFYINLILNKSKILKTINYYNNIFYSIIFIMILSFLRDKNIYNNKNLNVWTNINSYI